MTVQPDRQRAALNSARNLAAEFKAAKAALATLPDWARPEPFEHDRPTPDPCPPCDSRQQIDAFREWVDTYPPFLTGEGSTA